MQDARVMCGLGDKVTVKLIAATGRAIPAGHQTGGGRSVAVPIATPQTGHASGGRFRWCCAPSSLGFMVQLEWVAPT